MSRAQYAALVTQFAAKARATLKLLPLPGVSSDAGAVRSRAIVAATRRCARVRVRVRAHARVCTRAHSLSRSRVLVVHSCDTQNELMQLRIRSAKHEIMVAPDRDYTLIIIQGGPPKPV